MGFPLLLTHTNRCEGRGTSSFKSGPVSPLWWTYFPVQVDFMERNIHCSREILSGLGRMYAGGGEMTENIDRYGGAGTGVFANEAIQIYCS